jgi:four helix bundle protein
MEIKKKYITVADLEVYKLARELSKIGWEIYQKLNWQDKKIIGDQFITSTDSFGANLVEGYKRYHYLDKIKFYYNARASFAEANDYWIELLLERKMVDRKQYDNYKKVADKCSLKIQNFISATFKSKNEK